MLIYVTHNGHYKRKYRVKGLTRDGASTQIFPFEKDGKGFISFRFVVSI